MSDIISPGDVFFERRIGFYSVRRVNEDGVAWVTGPCSYYEDATYHSVMFVAPVSGDFLRTLTRVVTLDTIEGVIRNHIGWCVEPEGMASLPRPS